MVSIIRRMRKLKAVWFPSCERARVIPLTDLQKLLEIRIGPGAAILPSEVTRIHMDFALKRENGHFGPRKFWQTCLPRLKFHNPAIPMTINRTTDQKGPATMTIHFAPGKTSPAVTSFTNTNTSITPDVQFTSVASTEKIATISMRHKNESEILAQLLAITKATPLEPTQEELDQIRVVEEQQRLSEQDSKRSQVVNEKRRRTEAMLAQARGEVAAAQET